MVRCVLYSTCVGFCVSEQEFCTIFASFFWREGGGGGFLSATVGLTVIPLA